MRTPSDELKAEAMSFLRDSHKTMMDHLEEDLGEERAEKMTHVAYPMGFIILEGEDQTFWKFTRQHDELHWEQVEDPE
jgi:hypothetical protein